MTPSVTPARFDAGDPVAVTAGLTVGVTPAATGYGLRKADYPAGTVLTALSVGPARTYCRDSEGRCGYFPNGFLRPVQPAAKAGAA